VASAHSHRKMNRAVTNARRCGIAIGTVTAVVLVRMADARKVRGLKVQPGRNGPQVKRR